MYGRVANSLVTTVATASTPPVRLLPNTQVDEVPAEEGAEPVVPKSHKISLMQMAADDEMNMLVDQPEGVNATFSRALMKRASM